MEEETLFTEKETERNPKQYISSDVVQICNRLEEFLDVK